MKYFFIDERSMQAFTINLCFVFFLLRKLIAINSYLETGKTEINTIQTHNQGKKKCMTKTLNFYFIYEILKK